ncbi:MAG: MFS transporter [Candidatus Brocadia sp.]|nr:MFS transporter [Candidatus Brocadia sp.]
MNSVQRLMFIAGLYYFLQGMSGNPGLHRQALNFYLTQHMGFGAADLAYFTFLITIPWMVKPVYGIIADSLPLFGYRMKSYFILGSLFASLSYLTIFWFDLSNVSSLYLLFILPAVGIASSDVLCDKWMLVTGKPLNVTDRLQSAQWFSISLAGIIIMVLGGYIAQYVSLHHAVLFSLPFALMIIPLTVFSWKEDRVASVGHAAHDAKEGLRQAAKSRKLWVCAAFLFLFNAMPQLGSPVLYVYETNVLNFSQVLIGYLDMTANAGFIIGVALYGLFCKKLPEKLMLRLIVVSAVFSAICFIFFRGPFSAFVIFFGSSVIGIIAYMGPLFIAAKACPENAEGTVFALLMSVINFGKQSGNIIGGWIYEPFGFIWLVVFSTTCVAATWFLLPLVSFEDSKN